MSRSEAHANQPREPCRAVYFISLGKGEHVRSEAICLECRGMKLVDSSAYKEIVEKNLRPEDLIGGRRQ